MIRAEIYNYKQKQLDHCDKAKRVKIERERERAIGVRVEKNKIIEERVLLRSKHLQ